MNSIIFLNLFSLIKFIASRAFYSSRHARIIDFGFSLDMDFKHSNPIPEFEPVMIITFPVKEGW